MSWAILVWAVPVVLALREWVEVGRTKPQERETQT